MSIGWKFGGPVAKRLVLSVVALTYASTLRAQFEQQGSKLIAPNEETAALNFLAISGDGNTAIVGGSANSGNTGAALVYIRSGNKWTQQGGKLVGTGAIGNARQGRAVALSADGNTAIIGGPFDGNTGAAWVFTRSGNVWTQEGGKLVGSGAIGNAGQGGAVALSADGNTAIIGGSGDGGAGGTGAAWVFTRSGNKWTQQGAKLVGTGSANVAVLSGNSVNQGGAVALSADGNTAMVGGLGDNGGSLTGGVGAAWVFTRTGNAWLQQGGKLVGKGAVGLAEQGISVTLSGDGNTGIVGGSGDNKGVGAAWVFTRSGNVWTQQDTKLVCTGALGVPNLGTSAALSSDGNTAVVGGWGDGNFAGAAWVFTRSGNVWTQRGKLVGTGAAGPAWQGGAAALSADGNTAVLGGPADGNSIGAAWVFVNTTSAPVMPAITGVTNDATFATGGATGGVISPGSWVAIFGTGLAPAGVSRKWNEATEIVNGNLPVSLDGTSVTVNGKPAAVEFIQPSQVNILPPDDTAVGPVQVIVNTKAGASNPFMVNYAQFAPGLFQATSPYIVAQHADNSYVTTAAPAKPNEVIILWGTGFGPANPVVPAGQVFSGANPLANMVTITIGGQDSLVDFAGVVGAGLVQINVHVPSSINDGDATVVATVGGVSTQTTANMIPVHN